MIIFIILYLFIGVTKAFLAKKLEQAGQLEEELTWFQLWVEMPLLWLLTLCWAAYVTRYKDGEENS